MSTRAKFALITVAAGIPAFLLTPIFFPPNPSSPTPAEGLVPFFLFIGAVESLFFGLGIAFLIFAFPYVRRVATISGISPWPAYLAIGWLTAAWWPHLGMHRVVGMDLEGLLGVDYIFHLPTILAGAAMAHFFFVTVRAAARNAGPSDVRGEEAPKAA